MSFSPDHKINFEQLSPTLQDMIKRKITLADLSDEVKKYIDDRDKINYNYINQELTKLYNQLNQLLANLNTKLDNNTDDINKQIQAIRNSIQALLAGTIIGSLMNNTEDGQIVKVNQTQFNLYANDLFYILNVCDNDTDFNICKANHTNSVFLDHVVTNIAEFSKNLVYRLDNDTIYDGYGNPVGVIRDLQPCPNRLFFYNPVTRKLFFYKYYGNYVQIVI